MSFSFDVSPSVLQTKVRLIFFILMLTDDHELFKLKKLLRFENKGDIDFEFVF